MRIRVLGKYYPPEHGGIETLTRALCRGWAALGADVDCLVAHRQRRTSEEIDNGVRVHRLATFGTVFSTPLCPTYLSATRARASLYHIHLPNPLADLACLLVNRSTPVVLSYHSDIVRQRFLGTIHAPLARRTLRRAARIVVATPRHIDCSRVLSAFRAKCVVIPYGIDLARFELEPSAATSVADLRASSPGHPIVLNVGRLVGYKGQRHLLQALRTTPGTAWIVGTGPLETDLKRQAAALGIADRVRFWGDVPDDRLPLLYHACDLFALPSVTPNEAFGIAQVEAMACGKPVISCDLPSGVPFVNRHDVTGLIVPPADPAALAQAIAALGATPERARAMGLAGQQRARNEFDERVMVRRYWDCFAMILGS